MRVSQKDRDILRKLGERKASAAALPIQETRKQMWGRLNNLDPVKPMVWLNEVCWHEMNYGDELTLQTEDAFCRGVERDLRRTLYQWDHMQADMVVENVIYSPLAIEDSGFGIDEQVDIVRTDEASDIVSRHFNVQIGDESDVEKIHMPVVRHDESETETVYQAMCHVFGDILPVVKRGAPGFWFAPWDFLIRLTGVEQGLMDLALRPGYIHKVMDRLMAAYLHRLDQYEELGLLSLNNDNTRIGSGAYGYTSQLPASGFDPGHVRAVDLWGSATAQIFSEVSPAMHEEFALGYERRWLERFALTYYGCCEPLDRKMAVLRKIPNLRKISMSPWVDVNRAVEEIGRDYVYSMKPTPAVFADPQVWNPEGVREDLRRTLAATRDCRVEIIMKDISTVCYKPQRLWEWARIASEVTAEIA